MKNLRLNIPDTFTKELKIQGNERPGERRMRISSNLLQLMGFSPSMRYERRVLAPGAGFELRASESGGKKVYERSYAHRRNNPTETVIDDSNQDFLNAALPAFVDRVHLTMRHGVIIGRPVPEKTFHIRKALRDPRTPLEAFVALSSGIDAACLTAAGFGMQALLEYRPQERRDKRDLTESGVLTAMANNGFRIVLNEDIYRVNFNRVAELIKGQPRVAVLAASLQCDDFSPVKGGSLKVKHVEDLQTTVDMVYELLRLIETVQPATIHVENVSGFMNSAAGQLLNIKLRRWGYHVTAGVFDARDFGGATSRKRFYLVASVFPGFEAPTQATPTLEPGRIWRLIEDELINCRDATNTSSLRASLGTPRSRLITPESAHSPTILKSQPRHAHDSIFIKTPDGRYLFPTETILRRLQGLPDSFSLDAVSGEVGCEQIGQSVDWPMHHSFAVSIHNHLMANRSGLQSNATFSLTSGLLT